MPSISRILPAGLVAVLLTGCGASVPVDRVAGSSPSPSVTTRVPADGPRPGNLDSAPADAPTAIAPTTAAPVANACGLIRPADLVALVGGAATVDFPESATEEKRADFLVGSASICRIPLRTRFTDKNGVSITSGFVTVQLQTAGAGDYFPVHGEDAPVAGLGDDAMVRHYVLYVRLGDGMLVLTVAITTGPGPDPGAHNVELAEQLAPIAIGRL